MIRIIIADDHSLTREGLKNRILKKAEDMKVIGEASNADDLLKRLELELPDIIVMDISMPGKSGLEVLKEIRKKYPRVKVLVLSMHPEDRYAVRMVRAGAAGYLTKDHANLSYEVLKAIRIIATKNQRYISPEVGNQLVQSFNSPEAENHHKLSDREWMVFSKIAMGRKVREIAEDLDITVQTVHTYKKRAMNKLNLYSDSDLIRYAIQHNLVD